MADIPRVVHLMKTFVIRLTGICTFSGNDKSEVMTGSFNPMAKSLANIETEPTLLPFSCHYFIQFGFLERSGKKESINIEKSLNMHV